MMPLAARRPAVVFRNGIGDNLLMLMAVRALGALFPGRLAFLGGRTSRLFFADIGFVSFHDLDFPVDGGPGWHGRSFDVAAAAAMLEGCDLLISLNPWSSPSLQALRVALSPAFSMGLSEGFDLSLPMDPGSHYARLAFEIPRALQPAFGIDTFSAPLSLPPRAWRGARALRARLPSGARVLAVHADIVFEKMWPDRFRTLLDGFLRDHSDTVAVLVGDREIGLGDLSRHRPVISCLGLPLLDTMALVGSADLFLGVDSCMLHAADLFRVPGVGLFGPTNSTEYGFLFAPHRHLDAQGSMRAISVPAVRDALESVLS